MAEASPSPAPPCKRKRTNKPKLASIYAPQASAARARARLPALPLDHGDIGGDGPASAGGFDGGAFDIAVPNDDLLSSLHAHAAGFYAARGLLEAPVRRTRAPWLSQKRAALLAAGVLPLPTAGGGYFASDAAGGDDEGGGADDGGSDSESEGEERGGDGDDDTEDGAGAASQAQAASATLGGGGGTAPRAARAAGRKYKRRDMRLALDGTALLALGMLVEELVAAELDAAGVPPAQTFAVSESGSEGGGRASGDEDEDDEDGARDVVAGADAKARGARAGSYTSAEHSSSLASP